MIQSLLSFLLGFLVASALALLAAPALWRRAGALMRKRMEASMPMSREELQAEIDAVRAEHAMAMRRLEMKAEAVKKKAAQDLVEINLQREEAKRLNEELAARAKVVAGLEGERADLSARLGEREAELKRLSSALAETEASLTERMREVEELSRLYEEASLTASTRQVELVGREAEIEQRNDTINLLRTQRKEADRLTREATAEKTRLEEALKVERKRAGELERKVERMMSNLSTRDERLERREKEIARLKQKIKESAGGDAGLADRLLEAEETRSRLEMQVADLSLQLSSALAQGGQGGGDTPAVGSSEMGRLPSRLTALMRENKKLRAELATVPGGEGDEALREQISALAAEVVNMAAALEGSGSPIDQALAQAPAPQDAAAAPRQLSLAERVRALRNGAPAQ